MSFCKRAALAVLLLAGCSSSSPPPAKGHVVVAITIDWEGAYLSADGLDALDKLRKAQADVPITHFVSAAYFTKANPDPNAAANLVEAVRPGDELAVHLHAWRSLARAAGVEPKTSPSFLSGTDKLFEFDDGDVGFDTDLDVYEVPQLRALLRTSRRLLETTHLPVATTFRAGGYLGTPRMLEAAAEEGFTVDSSETDFHQLVEQTDQLAPRVHELWPDATPATQPHYISTTATRVLEMPIAAIADYVPETALVDAIVQAKARLAKAPEHDVFVVLAFHQETASDYAARMGKALAAVRARPDLAGDVIFTTVDEAAERARDAL